MGRGSVVKGICILLALVVACATPVMVVGAIGDVNIDKVVVIDAGHGGFDGGVVGSHGDKESDINLAIAKKLKSQLVKEGITVIMTREDKGALGKTKQEDMQRRKDIIRSSNADMVVSVHVNKFKDSRRRGVQVFYDDTNKWHREGLMMQSVMNEYINKKYAKRSDLVTLGGDYFMTKCKEVPSLIIECGFISNGEDEKLLLSGKYQDELASSITYGVVSILEMNI